MKDYRYTKFLGIFVGALSILGAIGFGFLAFIGLGLSKALNSGHEHLQMKHLQVFSLSFYF
ncbi:hypothetical protein [Bacillus salipaludis]|uniref:Uncharacterized protein n=1 Tax=Bacillus salipaludis TaxID=2547811 RepID=A0ABW8RJK8_9BACI